MDDRQRRIIETEQDYDFVFSTDRGKKVLQDLEKSFYHRISFTPGDPHSTDFKEGQRDVVMKIHRMIAFARNPNPDRFKVEGEEAANSGGLKFGSQ